VVQGDSRLQHLTVTGLVRTAKGVVFLGQRKGQEKLDLNDRWREVERELDEFFEAMGNGTEMEMELNEKCRKLPLQVRRISVSLSDVTDCPSSIPARRSESNALEIESIHAPSKMAHRRDVCCSGPTTWFRTRSPFVLVERHRGIC